MIAGIVNSDLEAIVRLAIRGADGEEQQVDGVIDTGFTGFLTLPPELIHSLGLVWLGREQGILADGSIAVFDVYEATVLWDGQPRPVQLEAAEADPLLGMRMLEGHVLSVEVAAGGPVAIELLP